jgi:hypothetical protein
MGFWELAADVFRPIREFFSILRDKGARVSERTRSVYNTNATDYLGEFTFFFPYSLVSKVGRARHPVFFFWFVFSFSLRGIRNELNVYLCQGCCVLFSWRAPGR